MSGRLRNHGGTGSSSFPRPLVAAGPATTTSLGGNAALEQSGAARARAGKAPSRGALTSEKGGDAR